MKIKLFEIFKKESDIIEEIQEIFSDLEDKYNIILKISPQLKFEDNIFTVEIYDPYLKSLNDLSFYKDLYDQIERFENITDHKVSKNILARTNFGSYHGVYSNLDGINNLFYHLDTINKLLKVNYKKIEKIQYLSIEILI